MELGSTRTQRRPRQGTRACSWMLSRSHRSIGSEKSRQGHGDGTTTLSGRGTQSECRTSATSPSTSPSIFLPALPCTNQGVKDGMDVS